MPTARHRDAGQSGRPGTGTSTWRWHAADLCNWHLDREHASQSSGVRCKDSAEQLLQCCRASVAASLDGTRHCLPICCTSGGLVQAFHPRAGQESCRRAGCYPIRAFRRARACVNWLTERLRALWASCATRGRFRASNQRRFQCTRIHACSIGLQPSHGRSDLAGDRRLARRPRPANIGTTSRRCIDGQRTRDETRNGSTPSAPKSHVDGELML